MLSYVFPAIVTLITGIFAVFAASHVCNKYRLPSTIYFFWSVEEMILNFLFDVSACI